MKVPDPRCYEIIGAGMNVHKELGHGFLENVYHEALMIEFEKQKIPFIHEYKIPISYQGIPLKTAYRADFVCYSDIIVEVKAIIKLGNTDISQVINYLKATGYNPGVLLNFGSTSLQYRRLENKFLNS